MTFRLVQLLLATQVGGADSSPHQISTITVRPDVRLEVLDWGGRGPALVLLAGYGDTAHVFDDFALQFTAHFHVLGITRRGFGASSRPRSGYDSATLAGDITRVLDSLGIQRAAFVAHSFGGSELNYLGAFRPDRVTRLVYLDASFDFPGLTADPRWQRAYPIPRPPLPETADSLTGWFARVIGPGFPPAEIREMNRGDGQDLEEVFKRGELKVDRSRIRTPVLALWADPKSVEDQYPYWASLDSAAQSRLSKSFAAIVQARSKRARARSSWPSPSAFMPSTHKRTVALLGSMTTSSPSLLSRTPARCKTPRFAYTRPLTLCYSPAAALFA